MKNNKNQKKVIAVSPAIWTDTSGNPSESYHWGHMATVRREWQHQFLHPYLNALEPTLLEITSTEIRVRTSLYPVVNRRIDISLTSQRERRVA